MEMRCPLKYVGQKANVFLWMTVVRESLYKVSNKLEILNAGSAIIKKKYSIICIKVIGREKESAVGVEHGKEGALPSKRILTHPLIPILRESYKFIFTLSRISKICSGHRTTSYPINIYPLAS